MNKGYSSPLLVGKRVIIIEDNGITAVFLKNVLVCAGLDVVGTVSIGTDGVALILRELPDIVLLDIDLPGEYNGIEVARRILAEINVCIVMFSGFSDQATMQEAFQSGACGYITKPVNQETFLLLLEAGYKNWKL